MQSIYETDKLLSEYLLFHYGAPEEILPQGRSWPAGMADALGFPVRTVGYFSPKIADRGLDLGCAVGRSAFEMSRCCRHVTGIDFSRSFIDAAERLRRGLAIPYSRLEEGRQVTALSARLPEGVGAGSVSFQQGDAMDLANDLGAFDRVHAANLLCRLSDPAKLLHRLPSLVCSGGELVLATPCTWLEEYTPGENWPDGSTLDWLRQHLSVNFDLLMENEEPFLIRETARKFQWSSSLVTLWRRK